MLYNKQWLLELQLYSFWLLWQSWVDTFQKTLFFKCFQRYYTYMTKSNASQIETKTKRKQGKNSNYVLMLIILCQKIIYIHI